MLMEWRGLFRTVLHSQTYSVGVIAIRGTRTNLFAVRIHVSAKPRRSLLEDPLREVYWNSSICLIHS